MVSGRSIGALAWAPLLTIAAVLVLPALAPQDPHDLASVDLADAFRPPVWVEGGVAPFWLGCDDQGRDVVSAVLHGARLSLLVGGGAVLLGLLLGVPLGMLAAARGGWVDAAIARLADAQLSFPVILLALLINGLARALVPGAAQADLAPITLVLAIAAGLWAPFARLARVCARRELALPYVAAARLAGSGAMFVLFRHVLPNIAAPLLVMASTVAAQAIITEASLSYLGQGVSPTTPSLGTLVRRGQDFLFSGEWWLLVPPAIVLTLLTLALMTFGDRMRARLREGPLVRQP